MEKENLQENAKIVGKHFRKKLEDLKQKCVLLLYVASLHTLDINASEIYAGWDWPSVWSS